MKKLFLLGVIFLLLFFVLIPELTMAWEIGDPLVPSPTGPGGTYTIRDFFTMLNNIYSFTVIAIATPLAILMITIGGIMILISGGVGPVAGGNATLLSSGKKIIYMAVIGLVLVFCSWLIVNFILRTLGYQEAWNVL